jgi:hypothetical protein
LYAAAAVAAAAADAAAVVDAAVVDAAVVVLFFDSRLRITTTLLIKILII